MVVLRGAGLSFSAGADLDEMRAGLESTHEERLVDARRWRALLDAVDGCPAPVVAGVHGNVLGGACGLLACCDVVVAARGTQVRVQRGEGRDRPGGRVAVRRGADRSGACSRPLRHGRAVRCRPGAPHRPDRGDRDDLDAGVERVVAEVLAGGPEAVRIAKRIAREPLEAGELAELLADLRASDEGQEGLGAFLERRPPSWRG